VVSNPAKPVAMLLHFCNLYVYHIGTEYLQVSVFQLYTGIVFEMIVVEKIGSSHRLILKIVIAIPLVIAGLLTASCGTVDMNLHTEVKPSGAVIQEVSIATTGMMTELVDAEFAADLEGQGWETKRTTSGETTILTGTKKFSKGETIAVLDLIEQDQSDNFKLKIENYLVIKDYYFELTLPEDTSMESELSDEDELIDTDLLESMFTLSWTVTMPGKIQETNADSVSGNSATWDFSFSSLDSGRYMMLHSRYINWLVIGIAAGCVVVVLLVVFLLRKPKKDVAYAGAEQAFQHRPGAEQAFQHQPGTGQTFQYRPGTAQSIINCYVCGYPNSMNRNFCVNCGNNLAGMGAQRTTSFQNQFYCSNCGYVNAAGSRFCGVCGRPLTAKGGAQSMGYQQLFLCPTCRATIYYGTNPCPYCGSKMRWS
jgi:hypothetical protein